MVVETLESRCLLSVLPAPVPTLTNGILSVTGTAGDDRIRISIIPHLGISSSRDKLAVKVNGTTTIFSDTPIQKIQINGLAGDDRIVVREVNIEFDIDGGDGNDIIFGGSLNDLISGGAGDDTLRGKAGDDVLNGGAGNDRLYGGSGNDSLLGRDERDNLRGGAGEDMPDGGQGSDRLRGDAGRDHSFDSGDPMLDATKSEKSRRYARPISLIEEDGSGETDQGDGGDDGANDPNGEMQPIWWDPEANTDDSGNPIDIPNNY